MKSIQLDTGTIVALTLCIFVLVVVQVITIYSCCLRSKVTSHGLTTEEGTTTTITINEDPGAIMMVTTVTAATAARSSGMPSNSGEEVGYGISQGADWTSAWWTWRRNAPVIPTV
jgi:hypothetical protein